jgi:hypothetical protein
VATVLFMKNAKLTLKIGAASAHDYAGQVKTAEVVVKPGTTTDYATLDGSVQTEIGASSYELHIVAGQVWDGTGTPPAGLARYLWDNEGQLATFELQAHGSAVANSTAQPSATGTVRLIAGAYGGEVNKIAEIDVTLPCQAKPTLNVVLAELEAEPETVAPADVAAAAEADPAAIAS